MFNKNTNFNSPPHYTSLIDQLKIVEFRHSYNTDPIYGSKKVRWDEQKVKYVIEELEIMYSQKQADAKFKGVIMMNHLGQKLKGKDRDDFTGGKQTPGKVITPNTWLSKVAKK